MYSHEHVAKILLFPYRRKYNISFFRQHSRFIDICQPNKPQNTIYWHI